MLSNLDIDCIEMTAYAIYRMRQARQSLDQDGLLIQQGEKLVKNPAANIKKTIRKSFGRGVFSWGLVQSVEQNSVNKIFLFLT